MTIRISPTDVLTAAEAGHSANNGSEHSYIDQDVTSASTPTFAVTNFTGSAAGIDSDSATHIASNGTDHSYIDQDVTNGAAPTFAVTNFTGSAAGIDSDATTHAASAGITHSYIQDNIVDITIAVADVGAGGTATPLTADLKDLAGSALSKTGVFLIYASDTQYHGLKDPNANITLDTVTKGSILTNNAAAGWWLCKADSSGQFACNANNGSDETVYFSCTGSDGGVDAVANGVIVRGCIPDDATWAA